METNLTVRLQNWLDRLKAGDSQGRDELLRHACERLRVLARRMLRRDFPRVREVQETDDVLQNALLRLHKALADPSVRPPTVADFLRLATLQIRRELIDLARHHFGPGQPPVVAADASASTVGLVAAVADSTDSPESLLDWEAFHRRVEELPAEERAVVELLWYQELSQAEAAEVLSVSVPTIKRRWLSARLRLQETLTAGGFPEM